MKFNFKIQQYQTDAVEAVCNVFAGQGFNSGVNYRRDLGKQKSLANTQMTLSLADEFGEELDLTNDSGFKNEEIYLSDDLLLKNIHELQNMNNIKLSSALSKYLVNSSLSNLLSISHCIEEGAQ